MAKRKKKKKKSSRRTLSSLFLRDRKTKKARQARQGIYVFFKVLAVVAVVAAIPIAFAFLSNYVDRKTSYEENIALLKLVNAPTWVNQQLKDKIYSAALASGENLRIDEEVATSVQNNIERLVVWLAQPKVRATHDSLLISGKWRKPVALVEIGKKYYVDAELVVLDYIELSNLPIVKVTGLATKRAPQPGQIWEKEDLAAAVDILKRLDKMDGLVTPEKPLLFELDRIDVTNYAGRYHSSRPHIELYAIDGTRIVWGAEIDHWAEHLEATDTEKIARLYNFYKQNNNTLLDTARYINLCDPQKHVPQPIDDY